LSDGATTAAALSRLADLRERGMLSDEEFSTAERRLLDE
jgi:hypothetical protein